MIFSTQWLKSLWCIGARQLTEVTKLGHLHRKYVRIEIYGSSVVYFFPTFNRVMRSDKYFLFSKQQFWCSDDWDLRSISVPEDNREKWGLWLTGEPGFCVRRSSCYSAPASHWQLWIQAQWSKNFWYSRLSAIWIDILVFVSFRDGAALVLIFF